MRRVLLAAGLLVLAASCPHPPPTEPICRALDPVHPREKCRLWAATAGSVMATVLCKTCGERPVSPSAVASQSYRCSRCRHATPAAKARDRRYSATAKRKAVMKRDNAKRIFVGRAYHSRVATVEHAQQINAHIRSRLHGLVERQQNREKAESPTTG